MKNIKFFATSILLSLFFFSCGSNYNTEFAPPGIDAKPAEVFPTTIGGNEALIQPINGGFQAIYGDKEVIIRVLKLKDRVEADSVFKAVIAPEFDKMPSHFRGQINGKWYAKGGDNSGMKAYGWVNMDWIFVIEAKSGAFFDEVVENFDYIE